MLLVGALIPAPCVMAQIAAAKPATGEMVRRPLVIIVHSGSTPDSLTAKQQVKLGEVGSPESVYTWPVNEAKSKPIRDLEGQIQTDVTGQPLELTRNKKGVISVDWSTARLSKDDPIDLSVTVNRPAALRPGIYRADIHAELKSDADVEGKRDELAKPRHLRWPLFVFVQGRLIRKFTFDDAKPRVGKPAALEIELQAIGCDLGEGRFQLDAVKSGTDLELALHVLLNQKNFQQI
jgi:hypothetical protein